MPFTPPPITPPSTPSPSGVVNAAADFVETVVNETTQGGEQAKENASEEAEKIKQEVEKTVKNIIDSSKDVLELAIAIAAYIIAENVSKSFNDVSKTFNEMIRLRNSLANVEMALQNLLSEIKHQLDRESSRSRERGESVKNEAFILTASAKTLEDILKNIQNGRIDQKKREQLPTQIAQSVTRFGTTLSLLRNSSKPSKTKTQSDLQAIDRICRALEKFRSMKFRISPEPGKILAFNSIHQALTKKCNQIRLDGINPQPPIPILRRF